MISFAKDGPDRNAAGCFRPSALGMTSLIILPEPTSSPLLTEMIGTSGGSTSCRDVLVIMQDSGICILTSKYSTIFNRHAQSATK